MFEGTDRNTFENFKKYIDERYQILIDTKVWTNTTEQEVIMILKEMVRTIELKKEEENKAFNYIENLKLKNLIKDIKWKIPLFYFYYCS